MAGSSVTEPEHAHKSILRGPLTIPHLRRTMAATIRSRPAPKGWDGGVPCTLIIAPAHLHGDWCACLKGCDAARVSRPWTRRRMDAAVYVCTVRTFQTAPQPMQLWWRVVHDCTDPEIRHSYSRRRNRAEVVGHLTPAAVHAWCVLPNHMTSVDTLYALDVLHRGRTQWMPFGHPHLQRPTRKRGEYGQWLVDMHHWKIHMHSFEDHFAIGQVQVSTVDLVNTAEYQRDPIAIPILMTDLPVDRRAVYRAWVVWVHANIVAQTDAAGTTTADASILDHLWRMCSTRGCAVLFPKSVVWDVHQAMCLLPIRMNPKPHPEQWAQIRNVLWAPSQTDGVVPECIVCTTVLKDGPLVVTECGHIVGACCVPKMVERGALPPVYRCPECRRIVTLGLTAWIVYTGASPTDAGDACEPKITEMVRMVSAKNQRLILVVTHFQESVRWIGAGLRANGFRVSYGKHRPLFARGIRKGVVHAHVAEATELRALELNMFCAAYVYDDGPNFEWLIDILFKNGIQADHIVSLRYRGTIEDSALTAPPFEREAHLLRSMAY